MQFTTSSVAMNTFEKATIAWLVGLAGCIAVWLASPWWLPLLSREHAPEWVSAIGSICAVAAAIFVVVLQVHFEHRRARMEEVRRLRLLWTFAYHCRVEMQYLRESLEFQNLVYHEPSGLKHNSAALSKIPTLDLVDADAAVAVLTIIEAYADFCRGTSGPSLTTVTAASQRIPHANAALANFEFAERILRRVLLNRRHDIPLLHLYMINGTPYPPLKPTH